MLLILYDRGLDGNQIKAVSKRHLLSLQNSPLQHLYVSCVSIIIDITAWLFLLQILIGYNFNSVTEVKIPSDRSANAEYLNAEYLNILKPSL